MLSGKVLGVDDASDEVKVFRNDVLAVIHKEVASDIKFDVVALLLGLEKIQGHAVTKKSAHIKSVYAENNSPLGNVQDGLKLELTLDGHDGKMLLPERAILLGRNILGISSPEGLGLVKVSSLTFFIFSFSTCHLQPPQFSLRPPSRPLLLLRHPQLPIVENRDIC